MDEHNCCGGDVQECIQKRAYELWRNEGCKPGRDQDYWLLAEKAVKAPVKKGGPKKRV
jgi:hypothetical protein